METLSTPDDVLNLFRRKAWIKSDSSVAVSQLTGGVSCRTWKIISGDSRWVLKQPLARLDTAVEWFADIRRIDREADSIRLLSTILEAGSVPDLEFADSETHSIVMTCAPDNAHNWKTQMMSGLVQEKTASSAGSLLSRIHERSKQISAVDREKFLNIQFFEELRIQPFHKYLAARYPELQSCIENLVDALRNRRTCFTHGDYSPKNMLVNPDSSIILLECEVAHWGNPVFDVAYCLGHLMLKGWALGRNKEFGCLIGAFLEAYTSETEPLLPHLGLMLLARLDGTSTVDYVVDPDLRSAIRNVSVSWIKQARNSGSAELPSRNYGQISGALLS